MKNLGALENSVFEASYGGCYDANLAETNTPIAAINTDYSLIYGLLAEVPNLKNFSVVAGGGLKNLGAAGWFKGGFIVSNNYGYQKYCRFGFRIRAADDVTFAAMEVSKITLVTSGAYFNLSCDGYFYLRTNETVFAGINQITAGVPVAMHYYGFGFNVERIA